MSTPFLTWARLIWVAACLLCGLTLAHADTAAGGRVENKIALIIGNSNYVMQGWALDTAARDATDMAKTLQKVGFVVTLKTDVDQNTFSNLLDKFAHDAESADIALFYFAGHGVQYRGDNYFLPVDAKPRDNKDMKYHSVKMGDVLDAASWAKTKIIILDACRNSVPDPDKAEKSRSATGLGDRSGLAQVDSFPGTVIFYSAQHGATALDMGTNGVNSPFAQSLLKHIPETGLEVRAVFGEVSRDVNKDTGGEQLPEMIASLSDNVFLGGRAETDEDVWKKIKNSNDVQAFNKFIKDFPDSDFVYAAQAKLKQLTEGLCRRDHEAISKLQAAKDLDGLRKLRGGSDCQSTPADVDAAIASVEGQARCDVEQRTLDGVDQRRLDAITQLKAGFTCDRVIQNATTIIAKLKEAAQQACLDERAGIDVYARGAREKLTALRDKASCSALRLDVDHEIGAFDRRVDGAQRELSRLGCLPPKTATGQFDPATADALSKYVKARKSTASPDRIDDALLSDLRGQAPGVCAPPPEQVAAACLHDHDAIQKLENAGDVAGLRAFGGDPICKTSRSEATIAAQRAEICSGDQQLFDKVDKKNLDAVTKLKGQLRCERIASQAETLVLALTEQARQKCDDDRARLRQIDDRSPDARDRMTSLKAECPAVQAEVAAAVKTLDDRVAETQRYLAAAACLTSPPSGRFDRDTLGALNAYRVARNISAREPRIDDDILAALRAERSRVCAPSYMADICQGEAAEIAKRESVGDIAGLQAFAPNAKCPASADAIKRAQGCVADQRKLDAAKGVGLAALKSLGGALTCEKVRQAATAEVARLEDGARQQVCDAETAKLAAIDVYAPDGRERLAALSAASSCPKARDDVAAAIKALDDRVAAAQRYLAAAACLASPPSGRFDRDTVGALNAYRAARNISARDPRIDDDVLAGLREERSRVCAPEYIADICQGEAAEIAKRESAGDVAGLQAFAPNAKCATLADAIKRAQGCVADQKKFDAAKGGGLAALKTMVGALTCERVRQAAATEVARLEDEARLQVCDAEGAKLAAIDVYAPDGRQRLTALSAASNCPKARDDIAAEIKALDDRVAGAQRDLANMGCLKSPPSGKFDDATVAALKSYGGARNIPALARLDPSTVDALHAQQTPVCGPPPPSVAIVCQGVFKQLEILEDEQNSAAMRARESASLCPTANEAVSSAIERVERCAAERRDFASVDQTSRTDVEAFARKSECQAMTQTASATLAALQAVCDKESEELNKIGVGDKADRLPEFKTARKCRELDTDIDAKVGERKRLITRAQTGLARLGCFESTPSGEFDAQTSDALGKYVKAYAAPVQLSSITDDLVARIDREAPRSCEPSAESPVPAITKTTPPPAIVKHPPVMVKPPPAVTYIPPRIVAPPPAALAPQHSPKPHHPRVDSDTVVAGPPPASHRPPPQEAAPRAAPSTYAPNMTILSQ